MYSQQYLDNLDSNQYDEFLFWSGQISKKGLDSTPNSDIMEPMKDTIEIEGDLRDEYLAIQEAEADAEVELVDEDELKVLLTELWQEECERELAEELEPEYTERDAFDDFYANQYEEWN